MTIAVPIFNDALERARREVDVDNARQIYSIVMTAYSCGDLVIGDGKCMALYVYNKESAGNSKYHGLDAATANFKAAETSYKGKGYNSFPKLWGTGGGVSVSFLKAICDDYGIDLTKIVCQQKKHDWFAVQISFDPNYRRGYAEGTGKAVWDSSTGIPASYFPGDF